MKRCTYCGKEYADDVTNCPVDQQLVTCDGGSVPSPNKAAEKHRSDLEIRAHLAARSAEVKFAVCLLAGSVLLDVVKIFINHPGFSRYSEDYISIAFTLTMAGVLLYFAFRGKNWARWVVAGAIVLGIFLPFALKHKIHWQFYFYAVSDIIAVVALFQRSSNEWFTRFRIAAEG